MCTLTVPVASGPSTLKCMWKCVVPNLSTFTECANGLALAHLLDVGSPYAMILLDGPSSSRHRESALTRSTAWLNCLVFESAANNSWYRKYDTAIVPIAPAVTRRKLKLCCVVRAAFSPIMRIIRISLGRQARASYQCSTRTNCIDHRRL
jgi:hypothetical protein